MDIDLWGQPVDTDVDRPAHSHSHLDIFNVENDLSAAERFMIGSCLCDQAHLAARRGNDKLSISLFTEADRYTYCGQQAVEKHCPTDGSQFFVRVRCRSRICETCGRIYRRAVEQKLLPMIEERLRTPRRGYLLSLLTLTVTTKRWGARMPEREDINRLYQETTKLLNLYYGKHKARLSASGKVTEVKRRLTPEEKATRRRLRREAKVAGQPKPNFKGEDRRIWIGAGWVATLEVGSDNNNAHVHAIVYGPIRQWFGLKTSWQKITGDSWGIDIKSTNNAKRIAGYVLKYITKPPATESYKRIAEYAAMIKGTRRIRTGGVFYNSLTPDRREPQPLTCLHCGSKLVSSHGYSVSLAADLVNSVDYWATRRALERGDSSFRKLSKNELRELPNGVLPVRLPKWH